jgi:hypothetical protein
LRDFNSNNDRIIALQNEPMGNGSGLDSFHTIHPEDVEPSNTPKIVGALAVALMVGVAGVGLYASSGKASHPKPIVTASNLPAAPAPIAAPAPQQQAAMTPDAITPVAPAATDNTPAPAPVKTASTARSHVAAGASSDTGAAASARMAADSSQTTNQPQQQAAVVAEPVSPTPSPSDIATNNTQSGVAVPQSATTASDMPAVQPAPAAPAPDQTAATPAPAQPAAQ